MKKLYVLILLLSPLVLLQCAKDTDDLYIEENRYPNLSNSHLMAKIQNLPTEDLSIEEEKGLIFMREEEKMARDVYINSYEKWGIQIFNNIANSEQIHMEAALFMLDKYELEDPTYQKENGEFISQSIQELYNDLIQSSELSAIEALKAGAKIEEIDILDLEDLLTNIIDNEDLEVVFYNLQRGSRNHLRAFVKNLSNKGIKYSPQYLSEELFDEIIASEMEHGE